MFSNQTAETADRQQLLLDWFSTRQRDLPWRQTRDPWKILVSELMLQQTQVARVVPRFDSFVARWPDPAACAQATVSEVVQAWSGLGYNRRAVNLHRCAQLVVERHGGTLPEELDALLALPGIGPYTARAVLVFAFETNGHGVLDTNAARVLARWHGQRLSRVEAQAAADATLPDGRSWAWNQAMLDLGATVCRSRQPRCHDCPVASTCTWWVKGDKAIDPAVGSSGVSGKQSRFTGSDRQGRGRLVEALRSGPVAADDLAAAMGWPGDVERATRVTATLVTDGLAVTDEDGHWHLPT